MTTVTDEALNWYHTRTLGRSEYEIDTIAVGVGTDSESENPDGLNDEVYRAEVENSNVEFLELSGDGQLEAVIRIKGGTEVSGGTEISEMMVVVSGPNDPYESEEQELIIAIDNFAGVEVESGRTEEFTMPVTIRR